MFENFQSNYRIANGVNIHYRIGGQGPGLLLLHGHPQTHFVWRKVADELAKHFTVVAADLRGYGDSEKPSVLNGGATYSKRTMAQDQVELMCRLGFTQFSILAHDRGARVAHRLAMDHEVRVTRMILLDIAPTLAMYEQTNRAFATAYWHWFFLIRPSPLPELLIESDPENYLRGVMGTRSAGMRPFEDGAFEEYLRCLRSPGAARGICEDYRASAGLDLDHDREDISLGRKLTCPLLAMWGNEGAVGQCFDPLAEWQKVAENVEGRVLACGHYIPEEMPEYMLRQALRFLSPGSTEVELQ